MLKAQIADLINLYYSKPSLEPFKQIYDSDSSTAEKIMKIMLRKKTGGMRVGTITADTDGLLNKIEQSISKYEKIQIYHGWGPIKNPNLDSNGEVDLAEYYALGFLTRLHHLIEKVYSPSVEIILRHDDARAVEANKVNPEECDKYISSIENLIDWLGVREIFTENQRFTQLYSDHKVSDHYKQAELNVANWESNSLNTGTLNQMIIQAKRNLRFDENDNEDKLAKQAAHRYLVCLEAEKLAGMHYSDTAIFASYNRFQDWALHFFTSGRGDITLPWQSVGAVAVEGSNVKPYLLTVDKQASLDVKEMQIDLDYSPKRENVKVIQL